MRDSLAEKVVIVTGGARGIGRTYSVALAERGARIMIADLLDGQPVVDEIVAAGGEAIAMATDVSSETDNDALAAATIERFGQIDVFVANAAMFSETTRGAFHEVPVDEWDRTFEVNVRGVWLGIKSVHPYMAERGSGKIITIASNTVFKGAVGFPHYVASKSALIGLTRSLATELGPDGITINCLSPDLIPDVSLRPTDDVSDEFVVAARALRRTMVADDMVGTMLYLCSDGSDFVTGQSLVVNGGAYYH